MSAIILSYEECTKRVNKAISSFSRNHKFLFENSLHEEALNHQLAQEIKALFPEFDVDCEYTHNTTVRDMKKNDTGDVVRPDIVIHRRGVNSFN